MMEASQSLLNYILEDSSILITRMATCDGHVEKELERSEISRLNDLGTVVLRTLTKGGEEI